MAAQGAEEQEPPPSPKSKMKFLCSHGGKILPRPADGHLKYVGGETRVLSVPRDINFSELKKRLSDLIDGDVVLKYQLNPEDLDALVSIRTDEDLKHMFNEYDRRRQESEGSPKLRTFLFPSKPTIVGVAPENQPQGFVVEALHSHSLEQRYIDAINGVVRTTSRCRPNPKVSLSPLIISSPTNTTTLSISSACSSPNSNSSPERYAAMETMSNVYKGVGLGSSTSMNRVQSSPSLYRPNSPQRNNTSTSHRPQQPQPHYASLYHNQQHYHHGNNYQSCSKPLGLDLQKAAATERLAPALSIRRCVLPSGHGVDHCCYSSTRHYRGSGGGYDLDFPAPYASHNIDRAETIPRSPRKKFWD